MIAFDMVPWVSLESRSRTAFLAGGAVLLGYAGLKSAELVTGPIAPDVLKVAIGHLGLLIPVLGLLGLYPQFSDSAPRLSLAGVVAAFVSGMCSIGLLASLPVLVLTMRGLPAIPEDAPVWGAVFLLVSLFTILLGFLLMGVASLRTDTTTRSVSLLLLVPAVMWISLFGMMAIGIDGTLIGVIVYNPIGMSLLALGKRLRAVSVTTDRGQPITDPVV